MHLRIYLALIVACLTLCAGPVALAQADKPVSISTTVCDRWTHFTKAMENADDLKILDISVNGRDVTLTSLRNDGTVWSGYGANTAVTLHSPKAGQRRRARFRVTTMDGQCRTFKLRYRIRR